VLHAEGEGEGGADGGLAETGGRRYQVVIVYCSIAVKL